MLSQVQYHFGFEVAHVRALGTAKHELVALNMFTHLLLAGCDVGTVRAAVGEHPIVQVHVVVTNVGLLSFWNDREVRLGAVVDVLVAYQHLPV